MSGLALAAPEAGYQNVTVVADGLAGQYDNTAN
jgi:hypothetical protein